jgi:tetratricopeptide (TPR) repeat protein
MLTDQDALSLLERLIGKDQVAAELEAAKRIVRLCGHLPLALRIAGGQLKITDEGLSEYASRLEDEHGRLKELNLNNRDVRASFMVSYQSLGLDEARLFRLLGLLPGESFISEIAIALADAGKDGARKLLNRLVDAQLLEPIGGGRYNFHDLVRLFARERLEEESSKDQKAACLRLAHSYVEETRAMNDWLVPEKCAGKVEKLAQNEHKPYEEVSRNEVLKALTWFETERANLLSAVEWAHAGRDWETTWRLAENLANFYNIRCHWAEWEHTHDLALEATRKRHDARHEGVILNLLGNVYRLQGRWDKAVSLFEKALKLHRKNNNPTGESIALNLLANVYRLQGRWDEAITAFTEALEINIRSGNRYGESIARGGLGNVYRMQGRWDDALKEYEKSLNISVELDQRRGECISLNNMGLVYSRQGRLGDAETALTKSQCISIEMKLPRGDCIALRTLGEVRMLQGRLDEAKDLLKQSLEIAKRQGDLRCTSQTLNSLGVWHTKQGNWVEADKSFDEALSILREMGDRHGEGLVLHNKGELLAVQDQVEEAVILWREALEKLNPSSPEYKEVTEWLDQKQLEHSPMLGV